MTAESTNVTEETTMLSGVRLHLLRGGSGRPALVLHGIEGPEGWLGFHDLLSRDSEVISPSHPGFGASERPAWMETITHEALFYEWFLRESGLTDVDLIGFGIGGWIAAEMAAMCSHNLAHLVLVDAAGIKPESGEILDVFIRPWRDVVQACVFDPSTAEEFQRIYGAAPIQDYGGDREAGRTMAMRLAYRPYMHSPALPSLLPGISTPTLVVWGAEDRIIPVECSRQFQESIPGARLEIIEECGHWPHYEKHQQLAESVRAFLRS
ncbi:MAG TPA: alpha/beta hydrolase [Dehalococcoidia bacterium]|nr:alpha/beta hydrolase [Dehalococcoidia bacterium]